MWSRLNHDITLIFITRTSEVLKLQLYLYDVTVVDIIIAY